MHQRPATAKSSGSHLRESFIEGLRRDPATKGVRRLRNEIRSEPVPVRTPSGRFHSSHAICETKVKARQLGGLLVRRCRLLLAPTRCCQTGEAEAEKGESAGFRDAANFQRVDDDEITA